MMPRSVLPTLLTMPRITRRVALACYSLADQWGELRGLGRQQALLEVNRDELRQALDELEAIGLVRVDREDTKPTVVTLLEWVEPERGAA